MCRHDHPRPESDTRGPILSADQNDRGPLELDFFSTSYVPIFRLRDCRDEEGKIPGNEVDGNSLSVSLFCNSWV